MKHVFEKVRFGNMELKNRLIRSATWEGIAAPDGGMMRLCDDALIPQYKKLTDLIHAEDVPVITQLALGAYYREKKGRYAETDPVMTAITGIHGNFYSNPFYYNIGETLNNGGIDFIYA